MNRGDFTTELVFYPDGSIYKGSEQVIESGGGIPADNALVGNYVRDPKHPDAGPIVMRTTNAPYSEAVVRSHYQALMAKATTGQLGSLSALSPGVGNAENLQHIQLIRLFPEIQGKPIEYFYLESMFKVRQIPQLEFRETWFDTVSTSEYRDRLEPSSHTKTNYDEIKYDLKKLVDVIYTPIEDLYRTLMNPQTIDVDNVRWAMKKKRNASALAALNQMTETDSIDTAFEAFDNNSPYHSKGNAANALNKIFSDFIKANDVRIDCVAMNPDLFAKYTSNTWTLTGPNAIDPQRISGGGVVSLPGIQGITCVVDVEVPDNMIYAINKQNALRLGEGPKLMRRYHDEDRSADVIKITDFHQFLSVDNELTDLKRKFGTKITVST